MIGGGEPLAEIQKMHETKTVRPESIIGWYRFYSHKLPRMYPERSKVDLVRTAALWMELTDRGGSPGFPYDYRSELGVSRGDAGHRDKPSRGWRLGLGILMLGIIALFIKPSAGIVLILGAPPAWYVAYRLAGGLTNPDLLLTSECQRVLEWSERQVSRHENPSPT